MHDKPQVIIVRGGLWGLHDTAGDPLVAQAGDMRWRRGRFETLSAFTARACREAAEAGEHTVVVGGLPS